MKKNEIYTAIGLVTLLLVSVVWNMFYSFVFHCLVLFVVVAVVLTVLLVVV